MLIFSNEKLNELSNITLNYLTFVNPGLYAILINTYVCCILYLNVSCGVKNIFYGFVGLKKSIIERFFHKEMAKEFIYVFELYLIFIQ